MSRRRFLRGALIGLAAAAVIPEVVSAPILRFDFSEPGLDKGLRNATLDLVLGGGGRLAAADAGAIAELEARNIRVVRIGATSAGAMNGLAFAAGVTSERLRRMWDQINETALLDPTPESIVEGVAGELGFGNGAFFNSDHIKELLKDVVEREHGVHTFGDLHTSPQDRASDDVRELYRFVCTAKDITLGRYVSLPWDYHWLYGLDPDRQSPVDAVIASMAFPHVFPYQKIGSSLLADPGGFPIDMFDIPKPIRPVVGVSLQAVSHDAIHEGRSLTPKTDDIPQWNPLQAFSTDSERLYARGRSVMANWCADFNWERYHRQEQARTAAIGRQMSADES